MGAPDRTAVRKELGESHREDAIMGEGNRSAELTDWTLGWPVECATNYSIQMEITGWG
jgi:hypothetical protein